MPDDQNSDGGGVRKYSVTIAGHRTSISLEPAFWDGLQVIAREQGVPLAALITRIDRERSGNLSSAIRLHVLARYRDQAGT